jgi:hypothetical protein
LKQVPASHSSSMPCHCSLFLPQVLPPERGIVQHAERVAQMHALDQCNVVG